MSDTRCSTWHQLKRQASLLVTGTVRYVPGTLSYLTLPRYLLVYARQLYAQYAHVCVMQGQGHHPYHCATATSDSPPHHTDSPRGVECSRYAREEKIQGQARVLLVFLSAQWEGYFFYLLNEEGYLVLAKGKSIYVYIFLTRLYSTDLR